MSSNAQAAAAHNIQRVKHQAHSLINAGTRHAGHHTLPPAQPSATQAAAAKQLHNMLRRVKGHGLGKGTPATGGRKKTMKKKNRKHKTHRRSR